MPASTRSEVSAYSSRSASTFSPSASTADGSPARASPPPPKAGAAGAAPSGAPLAAAARCAARALVPPPAAEVASRAPARACIDDALNREAAALLDAQLRRGVEVGAHAVAYHRGAKVLDVVAGLAADVRERGGARGAGAWAPVEFETRFMAWSVTKGVVAAAIARLVDGGCIEYDEPLGAHWAEFGSHGGKGALTLGEALAHRAGLRATWLAPRAVLAAALGGRFDDAMAAGQAWVARCTPQWRAPPSAPAACYHPTSWAWLAAAVCAHAGSRDAAPEAAAGRPRRHVRDAVAELCASLGAPRDALRVGELGVQLGGGADGPAPREGPAAPPVAAPVAPRALSPPAPAAAAARAAEGAARAACAGAPAPLRWALALCAWACVWAWAAVGVRLLARLEACALSVLGGCAPFLGLCLPSSNGLLCARALGRLYAALANGGALPARPPAEPGCAPLSAPLVDRLRAYGADEAHDAWGWPLRGRAPSARLTFGWSPWLGAQLERAIAAAERPGAPEGAPPPRRRVILGHNGVGGCVAYAELPPPGAPSAAAAGCAEGYAFVLLKNAHTPDCVEALTPGGTPGVCETARLLDALVRRHLRAAPGGEWLAE